MPLPTSPVPAASDRHFVTALARGLEVLAAFGSGDRLLANQELARRTGLPKSTVSRLTSTLTQLGYLVPADDGPGRQGYQLGSAVMALGSTMLGRLEVRATARPLMQELARRSNAMVSLGMRDRLSMVYVENCRSEAALALALDVGSRIPIATTAMGRAYLAACGEIERADLLQRLRDRHPKAWPRVRDGIERALDDQQRLGCCTSFGDWQGSVHAIAVAFRPANSRTLVAVNCGGQASRLAPQFLLERVRPQLVELARRMQQGVAPAPAAAQEAVSAP